jgi:hypothetical protein
VDEATGATARADVAVGVAAGGTIVSEGVVGVAVASAAGVAIGLAVAGIVVAAGMAAVPVSAASGRVAPR